MLIFLKMLSVTLSYKSVVKFEAMLQKVFAFKSLKDVIDVKEDISELKVVDKIVDRDV